MIHLRGEKIRGNVQKRVFKKQRKIKKRKH